MIELIGRSGYEVTRLPALTTNSDRGSPGTSQPEAGWRTDAERTRKALLAAGANWLVVDHYGLDQGWERVLRGSVRRVMVIDDLANRRHDCDVLLDQNFTNPRHERYSTLVPYGARQFLGSRYALVRPEFAELRQSALERRNGRRGRLFVSMGASDPPNDTAKALAGLKNLDDLRLKIDVVVGQSNPWKNELRELCAQMPLSQLHVQTPYIANLMTRADVAINAGGSTTWERCVLGLPAIVAIQSDDQSEVAEAVGHAGAQQVLGRSKELGPDDYARSIRELSEEALVHMSNVSAALCDGRGAARIADEMMGLDH